MVDAPKPLGSQPPGPGNWEVSPPDGPMAPSGPASQSPERADPAADFVPSGPPASSAARYAVELTVNPGDGTPATSGEDGDRATKDNAPDTAAGDGPNEPPGPPDAPTAPDTPEDPKAKEIADMRQSLRESADIITTALTEEPYPENVNETLALTAEAVAIADGPEAARVFLKEMASRVGARPSQTVEAWTALYKNGDPEALPEARQAIDLASGELTPRELEAMARGEDLGGVENAERLVGLVEAGDKDSMVQAKSAANTTPTPYRALLLARIYAASDERLFSVALGITRAAIREVIDAGGDDFSNADKALNIIADAAIKEGRPTRARRALDSLSTEQAQIELHAKLYEAGHSQSMQPLARYLATVTPENAEFAQQLERRLALAGHKMSQAFVGARVKRGEEADQLRELTGLPILGQDIEDRMPDLEVMHKLGSPTAADTMAKITRNTPNPVFADYLKRAGKLEEAEAMARHVYKTEYSPHSAEIILSIKHDPVIWRKWFNLHMEIRHFNDAAGAVRDLAKRIRQFENPEAGA